MHVIATSGGLAWFGEKSKQEVHAMHASSHETHAESHHASQPYARLLLMLFLSFVAMYVLMYAMVDRPGNTFHNLNQMYMAGLMISPMLLIELWLMRAMYPNRRANLLLLCGGFVVGALCWFGIRDQWGVSDRQFLRSMIPHHAGALLMCREADLRSPNLERLCEGILQGQQAEIEQMRTRLQSPSSEPPVRE